MMDESRLGMFDEGNAWDWARERASEDGRHLFAREYRGCHLIARLGGCVRVGMRVSALRAFVVEDLKQEAPRGEWEVRGVGCLAGAISLSEVVQIS